MGEPRAMQEETINPDTGGGNVTPAFGNVHGERTHGAEFDNER